MTGPWIFKPGYTVRRLFAVVAIALWLFIAAGAAWGFISPTHPQPHGELGPATVVVKLPNGTEVTCITVGQAMSCDFLGFTTDPNYKAVKP